MPVAKNPQTVRGAQLAVLELLKQPEGSDVSWPIKMFGGIHHLFKQSLSGVIVMSLLVASRRKNDHDTRQDFYLVLEL